MFLLYFFFKLRGYQRGGGSLLVYVRCKNNLPFFPSPFPMRFTVGHPRFPFTLRRGDLGTIDGDKEAFYAVLSANYLKGRIDAMLRPTGHEAGEMGALDMGKTPRESFGLGGVWDWEAQVLVGRRRDLKVKLGSREAFAASILFLILTF